MKGKLRKLGLCVILVVLSLPLIGATRYQGSDPIRVLSTTTENDYPDGLTFNITAEADTPITSINLYYYIRGDTSTTRQPLEINPGTQVSGSYTWDTSGFTVPPSAPVYYYWELDDETGNELVTDEQLISYDDLRFPWNELSDDEIIVRWYEGDQEFGDFVYQTSRQALDQMKAEAGRGLDFPITILLYANADDFRSWHFYVDDWVGGQAFTQMGITTQIIGPTDSRSWIQDVIPHEIAHLFFYQAVHTPMANWPAWLDEGMAMHYEFSTNAAYLALAEEAARDGTLLPLSSLSGGFGRDPDQVHLSYAESFSAVLFLMETWGDEALQSLIGSFRRGVSHRIAIEDAIGFTWEEFIAQWITWMGVPATPAAPPTPTEGLVFPTAPSGWPTVTPRAQTDDTDLEGEGFQLVDLPVCGGLFGAIAFPGISLLFQRRRRKDSGNSR
jgi:hypothetical protein